MPTREHLTCENVAAGLREFNGNMAAVARKYGVGRTAVQNFVTRHPSLLDVVRECRESMIDHAESSLQRAFLAGEAWAVCFYLKCQGKGRGYIERVEHEHTITDNRADEALDALLSRPARNGSLAGHPAQGDPN